MNKVTIEKDDVIVEYKLSLNLTKAIEELIWDEGKKEGINSSLKPRATIKFGNL